MEKMNINPLSFGQNHIKSAYIKNNQTGKKEKVNFVQYEYGFYDMVRIHNTIQNWREDPKNRYGERIYKDYMQGYMKGDYNKSFYGLEDENENILGLIETNSEMENINLEDEMPQSYKPFELTYFCTNPDTVYGADKRKYSKVGTVMLSETIKEAKRQNADYIALFNADRKFWDTIPCFRSYMSDCVKILEADKFDTCTRELDKRV